MDDFSTDDFLARERAALGGDANLFTSNDAPSPSFDLPSTDFPELGDDDSAAIPSLPPVSNTNANSSPSAGPGFPSIASLAPPPSRQAEVTITGGDDELDKFESEFPDVAEFMPQDIQSAPAPSSFQYGQSPYAAAPSAPTPSFLQQDDEPESEAITNWKVKQAEEIKARDEKSKAKREETIVKAEQAIDKFYEDYNAGKERSIKENKENEAAFLADLSASLSQGTTWERIADLVGLENSQSKTLARSTPGGSDLARMKEVLLRLKRQGENAPGAKGY